MGLGSTSELFNLTIIAKKKISLKIIFKKQKNRDKKKIKKNKNLRGALDSGRKHRMRKATI